MKKPKPQAPPGHVVAHIYKPVYDNEVGRHLTKINDVEYIVPDRRRPPPFHCVPGPYLNWSPERGFAITPVQAIALCGAQPNPQDPVFLNNRDRDLRESVGLVNGTWEAKHWVQEMDPSVEVSCNKCLAAMRAALRVKLRFKPVYEEARAAGYWTPAKAKRSKPRNEMAYARHDGSKMALISFTAGHFLASDDDPDAP